MLSSGCTETGEGDAASGRAVPCLPQAATQPPSSQAPNLWL